MIQEWNIRTRGHECARCGKGFEDGDCCVSTLKLAPEEGGQEPRLVRDDFCEKCWGETKPGREPDDVSTWRGKYKAPEPPPPDPTPRQTVESLLRQLAESDSAAERQAEIYLLAVMLERKRILLERGARPQGDGTILRVYEFRKTGEALLVTDPCIQVSQLESARDRIAALLDPPQPPAAAPDPASAESASEPAAAPPAESAPGVANIAPAYSEAALSYEFANDFTSEEDPAPPPSPASAATAPEGFASASPAEIGPVASEGLASAAPAADPLEDEEEDEFDDEDEEDEFDDEDDEEDFDEDIEEDEDDER